MIGNSFFFSIVKAAAAVVVLVAMSAGSASAASLATCSGGSIAPGVYSSLNITGACAVDSGSVTVEHNLTVLPGASLVAVTGGVGAVPGSSDLTVGGNLDVQAGGVLNLGCEPSYYTCPNDPAFPVGGAGTYTTHHTVAGNLTIGNALGVVIHHTVIGGNVSMSGGGGGVAACSQSVPGATVLSALRRYRGCRDRRRLVNHRVANLLAGLAPCYRQPQRHFYWQRNRRSGRQ